MKFGSYSALEISAYYIKNGLFCLFFGGKTTLYFRSEAIVSPFSFLHATLLSLQRLGLRPKNLLEFYVYGQFYTNKSLDNIDWGGGIIILFFDCKDAIAAASLEAG